MPDLITHVSMAHLILRGIDSLQRRLSFFQSDAIWLYYLGTILQDLLTRPVNILFPSAIHWTIFLHTPLAMTVVHLMLVMLFEGSKRQTAFLYLTSGSAIHFLVDALQKQVIGNNFWLYPLSWHNFSLKLFWAHEFMAVLPYLVSMIIVLETVLLWRPKMKNKIALTTKSRH